MLTSMLCGAMIGLMLGVVGGGGSILATPLLLYGVGIAQPHVAIGTGALAVSFNAYANFIAYARKGYVWWNYALLYAGAGTVGALLGSELGKATDGRRLMAFFGVGMILVGGLMLRERRQVNQAVKPMTPIVALYAAWVALCAGLASGFFGIGGGFLIVPGLILVTGMPMVNAVATSLFVVGTLAATTALSYSVAGLIDVGVAIEFIVGGLIGGGIALSMADKLAQYRTALSRVFAVMILIVATYIIRAAL